MKDNALVKFNNDNFGNVRALLIDGNPWFVGKDVAQALGYKKPRNALENHVPDKYKKDAPIQGTLGGTQKMTLINEAGLYKLIFASKLPSAEKFSDWVCEDVMPTLRKTGTYTINRDARWIQTRLGTKTSHRPFTEAIKMLIEYLDSRGQRFHDAGYVYGHLTNLIQSRCDIKRGQRDNAPVANLNKLDQVQNMVTNVIVRLIVGGKVCTLAEFEANIILQLDALNRLLGGDMLTLE